MSNDSGKSFTPLCHLADIEPLACAAGTSTGDTCAPFWPPIEQQLNLARDAGADASAIDAAPDAEDAAVDASASPPRASSGCGCTLPGARPARAEALALAFFVWLAGRRRNRASSGHGI